MTRRAIALAFCLVAVAVPTARASTVRYVLTSESRLVPVCPDCAAAGGTPQVLRGSFELSRMPKPVQVAVEALTSVRWSTDTLRITGAGFLQHLGDDRVSLVIDGRFNGVPLLLKSGGRPRTSMEEIRLQLTSPTGGGNGFLITLVAVPAPPEGPDTDGDGVVDGGDNCPAAYNSTQGDSDRDSVGDACDACADTPSGGPVLADGCSLPQICPCDGPSEDEEWPTPRAYVQCVARGLKQLRQQGRLDRVEVRLLLQDAVRSGCGRRIIALR